VKTSTKHCSEIQINKRERLRCERDNLSGKSIVRLLRLKPNASGDLCPTGQQFAFAERHLPSFIAMLQALQNGEAI
jgi:hypothetical protein